MSGGCSFQRRSVGREVTLQRIEVVAASRELVVGVDDDCAGELDEQIHDCDRLAVGSDVGREKSDPLTTSSYAILGLLAIQPWTGYELTQQATRSLRFAWPKSERLLYSEPKKLVDLGMATTHKENVGNRTRNVYEITDAGQDALSRWTTTETAPPQLEAEALLRLLFADAGGIDDLHRALDELRSEADSLHDQVLELMRSYLNGGHPFPERAHLSVLFATFQLEIFDLISRWVDYANDYTSEWDSTSDRGLDGQTLETLHSIDTEAVLVPPRKHR